MANIVDELRNTPLWVKVFGIIGIVVILLVVIILVTGVGGPGSHGPGRHSTGADTSPVAQSDGPEDHTPPIQHEP